MLRPSIHKDYQGKNAYYNRVQIGLAPAGKVAVWLNPYWKKCSGRA
ncbi:DUF2931 family protein [Erwinia amylovora]